VLRKLRPAVVCIERPSTRSEEQLQGLRDFISGSAPLTWAGFYGLYSQGYRSAALERFLGPRTDHMKQYSAAQLRCGAVAAGALTLVEAPLLLHGAPAGLVKGQTKCPWLRTS
jgi:hypothetical protein